ncbi:MAG: FtsX-like permease family protein [Acidimicrobiia bacterium]|nr:FtsX-like permease family protein [Acidimicrobiia bacterium]
MLREALTLALESIRVHTARSVLAIVGLVIGIVTVVLVASTLVGLRNSVAQLFRELGSDNIFAFHRNGDPYTPASDADANRRVLTLADAQAIERLAPSVRDVGVQLLIPAATTTRVITARAGGNESDTVLIEGASPNFFDVTDTPFSAGRPFTETEDRVAAPVAVLGANIATALFGQSSPLGQSFLLGGDRYYVVGVLAPRQGTFFGENRNDSVVSIPLSTARQRFPEAEQTVIYARARAGLRETARAETETVLRLTRQVPPGAESDFNLSTADQIIAQFDRIGAQIFLATLALAAVSLVIGGIGIANVMVISVTERTREIGLRLAIGARRQDVRLQFLLESAVLAGAGGVIGVTVALAIGATVAAVAPAFPALPPLWAVVSGVVSAVGVGVIAGYLPARRASRLDPVESLRYE